MSKLVTVVFNTTIRQIPKTSIQRFRDAIRVAVENELRAPMSGEEQVDVLRATFGAGPDVDGNRVEIADVTNLDA